MTRQAAAEYSITSLCSSSMLCSHLFVFCLMSLDGFPFAPCLLHSEPQYRVAQSISHSDGLDFFSLCCAQHIVRWQLFVAVCL
jgi:hypothetical protein